MIILFIISISRIVVFLPDERVGYHFGIWERPEFIPAHSENKGTECPQIKGRAVPGKGRIVADYPVVIDHRYCIRYSIIEGRGILRAIHCLCRQDDPVLVFPASEIEPAHTLVAELHFSLVA